MANEQERPIIGRAVVMQELFSLINKVSSTKTNILITGESGTGKELVARAIHFGGVLKNKPFVAVNCGAIPETLIESELFGHKRGSFTGAVGDKDGLFKAADGGTIFLDEVGELPMSMQVKLLRVLQDRSLRPVGSTENIKVDVRVISATNRDLEEGIRKGTFREDLYYRLNVIQIKTPSLRDRREDIPALVNHFINKLNLQMNKKIKGLTQDAMNALQNYPFPGNVRELENTIERSLALESSDYLQLSSLSAAIQDCLHQEELIDENKIKDKKSKKNEDPDKISKSFVPPSTSSALTPKEQIALGPVKLEKLVEEFEKEYILAALEKNRGIKKKAAAYLGLTFRSLRYRIQKYGIQDLEGSTDADSDDESDKE